MVLIAKIIIRYLFIILINKMVYSLNKRIELSFILNILFNSSLLLTKIVL